MFETIFCGLVGLKNGHLGYANGGHEAPMLWWRKQGLVAFDHAHGPALGLFEDGVFPTLELVLESGDTLLTYTDGVTEAVDRDQRFFTKERLIKEFERQANNSVKAIVESFLQDVVSFSEEAYQSDDITIVALRIGKTG